MRWYINIIFPFSIVLAIIMFPFFIYVCEYVGISQSSINELLKFHRFLLASVLPLVIVGAILFLISTLPDFFQVELDTSVEEENVTNRRLNSKWECNYCRALNESHVNQCSICKAPRRSIK